MRENWERIHRCYYFRATEKGPFAGQVYRGGSRKMGAGWRWWAYGAGQGESSTLESGQKAVEKAYQKQYG